MKSLKKFSPTILRLGVGLVFLIPGISKLSNTAGIIGLVGNLGFPLSPLLGWLVILSEIFMGLAILIGYKVRYAVWPLLIVMLVATFGIILPSVNSQNPQTVITLLFHILATTSLLSLSFSGAGALAVDKGASKMEKTEEM